MYPSILGSFVGFCTTISACQPPFYCGEGGGSERNVGVWEVGVVAEYPPGVVWIAGAWVWWCGGGGANRFCGRFLGRGRVFG